MCSHVFVLPPYIRTVVLVRFVESYQCVRVAGCFRAPLTHSMLSMCVLCELTWLVGKCEFRILTA